MGKFNRKLFFKFAANFGWDTMRDTFAMASEYKHAKDMVLDASKDALSFKAVNSGGVESHAEKLAKQLANRIIWLNSIYHDKTNCSFINGWVEKSDISSLTALADEFVEFTNASLTA